MDRDYKTGKSDGVGVFSGLEVEHTPAFGKQTLFLARNDLYFDQIEDLARKGYYVTIDYPHAIHDEVKARFETIWTHEKFIPFCSIIFPKSEDDDNLCIKVDDVDFNSTNPGVWTMTMDHFKQTAGFTSWNQYNQDEPIEEIDAKKVV